MAPSSASHRRERISARPDIERAIFDGDRDLRSALEQSRALSPLWRDARAMTADGAAVVSSRQSLLKTAVRLTAGLAPGLHRSIERCRRVLGVTAPIDVFCVHDVKPNAFVLPPRGGRLTMGFSSSALQMLDDGELTSVIGHELGHAIFDHHAMMALTAVQGDERLAPIDAMRFFSWLRYAELSADRVGLLCCGDLDVALSAEFKMASGLSDQRVIGDVREASKQFAALEAEAIETDENDWFATHPYGPLRVRALELFARSTLFHALMGREGGELSESDLELEVTRVGDLMSPVFLSEKATCRREVGEFLVFAGVEVALADRRLKRSEVEVLRRLVGGEGKLADGIDEVVALSAEQRGDKIDALRGVLNVRLSPLRRGKLIEDVTAVALADRRLDAAELDVLYRLAAALGVDPLVVDRCVARPEGALD